MSGSLKFENILSIRVLEWLVIWVGSKIKGINELCLIMLIIIQEVKIKVSK